MFGSRVYMEHCGSAEFATLVASFQAICRRTQPRDRFVHQDQHSNSLQRYLSSNTEIDTYCMRGVSSLCGKRIATFDFRSFRKFPGIRACRAYTLEVSLSAAKRTK